MQGCKDVRTQLSLLQPYNWIHVKQLTGGASNEAASLLNVCPRSYFHMPNEEMISILRRRFQIKDPDISNGLKCKCGNNIDPYGWHLQTCRKFSKFCIRTHEEIKSSVGRILQIARVRHNYEILPFKDRDDEKTLKRLDIVMQNPRIIKANSTSSQGLIDVTITNSVESTMGWMDNDKDIIELEDGDDIVLPDHSKAATVIGGSAKKAEHNKLRKYETLAKQHDKDVFPMGFETQGTWGPGTHKVFDALMKRIGDVNNPDKVSQQMKSHYWRQHLTFILHKYVARHIIDAFATIPLTSISNNTTPNYSDFD